MGIIMNNVGIKSVITPEQIYDFYSSIFSMSDNKETWISRMDANIDSSFNSMVAGGKLYTEREIKYLVKDGTDVTNLFYNGMVHRYYTGSPRFATYNRANPRDAVEPGYKFELKNNIVIYYRTTSSIGSSNIENVYEFPSPILGESDNWDFVKITYRINRNEHIFNIGQSTFQGHMWYISKGPFIGIESNAITTNDLRSSDGHFDTSHREVKRNMYTLPYYNSGLKTVYIPVKHYPGNRYLGIIYHGAADLRTSSSRTHAITLQIKEISLIKIK